MAKTSQRQIVAAVDGRPYGNPDFTAERPYFSQVSGGNFTSAVEKVYDGGQKFPETLPAPREIGELTVTRPYDPEIDEDLLRQCRDQVGEGLFDVTVYVLLDNLRQSRSTRIFPQARLVGISDPEGDAASGAAAMFSLTFALSTVAA